jgi:hypothetical protein
VVEFHPAQLLKEKQLEQERIRKEKEKQEASIGVWCVDRTRD